MAISKSTRLLFVLALFSCVAQAGMITASFSGNWGADAGMIRAGDPFFGTALWDDSGLEGATRLVSTPLHSFTFSMIPGEIVSGAESWEYGGVDLFYYVHDPLYWRGELESLRIRATQKTFAPAESCDGSPASVTSYVPQYAIAIKPTGVTATCYPRFGFGPTATIFATNYQISIDPVTAVASPEPSTFVLIGLALAAMAWKGRKFTASRIRK